MLAEFVPLIQRLAADEKPESIFENFDPLDSDAEPKMIDDEEQNLELSFIGEILIGFGIVTHLAAWFTQSFSSWATYARMALSLGSIGVWVWGFLKWLDAQEQPTDKTYFRSWRINFINFWVAAGVTVINAVLSFAYPGDSLNMLAFWSPYLCSFIAAGTIITGIILGWRMLNLWWIADPTGSLAEEDFDYFKWTDVTDELEEEEDTTEEAAEEDAEEDVEEAEEETEETEEVITTLYARPYAF